MATILRDEGLKKIGNNIKVDAKRRVTLPINLISEEITYHVYANKLGQIVLDPQVTIPVSEAWVFKDKKILDSMDKAMVESANGQTVYRGSFAKYVKDDL